MEEKDKIMLYRQKGAEFRLLRSTLERRAASALHLKKGLRQTINQMRPVTENGVLICAPCDMVSMVPVEVKYGPHHDLDHTHECEVCYGTEIGRYS